jgi:tetratricopeptide (TPR) repeat protein
MNLSGSIPTNVVVFRSASSYKPFKPLRADGKADTGIAGYFQPGEDVNYITLSTEGSDADTFGTIFHEYVHFVLNTNFGKSDVPLWFNEGLAEYYQTFEIADDIDVKLGLPQSNHIYLLQQSKLMPLDMLFNATHHQVHGAGGHSRSIFYAQSWALMHYLIQSGKTDALGNFLARLRSGAEPQPAFEQAFQTTYKQMENDLRKYISGSSYKYSQIRFKTKLTFDNDMQVSMLDDATSNAYLGDLLYHSNRPDDAERYLIDALKTSPDSPLANTALGMVKIRQRKFDDARRYLEKAIASDPKNHSAYYQYAYLLSREGRDEFGFVRNFAPATAAKMREALRKSIALNPAFTESYELLAFVAVVNNDELDDAIAQLQKALEYQPGNQRYALRMAEIYSRQNKLTDAKTIAEKIARTTDSEDVKQRAEQLMAMAVQREEIGKMRGGDVLIMSEESTQGPSGPPKLGRSRVTEAEHAMLSITEALRPLMDGERRVIGRVQKIDCTRSPVVYTITADGETFTLASKDFEGLTVGAFDATLGSTQVSCEGGLSSINTVITYSPGAGKTRGELVALEFVPGDFRLLPETEIARLREAAANDWNSEGASTVSVETIGGMPDEAARRKMMMDAMKSVVKTPGLGEKRETGLLQTIECKGRDMIFVFSTKAGMVKVAAPKQPQIRMFVQDLAGMQFGCGLKPIDNPAVFVYTSNPNSKTKSVGDLIALDLMPIGFVLE